MVLKSTKRMIQSERRRFELAVGGISPPIFMFDPALVTFTPGMAIRAGQGPFDGAPIVQGMFDGSGVPDGLNLVRGDQIHNNFYANFDTYQGTIGFWWIPEKDRDAGQTDDEIFFDADSTPGWSLKYEHDNAKVRLAIGGQNVTSSLTIVAGTTYFILARWDMKNALDGTNFLCVSVNDVHSFGGASPLSAVTPDISLWIGSFSGISRPLNGIIEGLTFYRRPLFDGQYGVCAKWDDSGPVDEMNAIFAAGAGADPCLITGGSFDIPFCLPTNSDVGSELVTGPENAWSHPHSSGVLEHQWMKDGGYLGRPYGVLFNATNTRINCGSDATLDDVVFGANGITYEGWFRADDYGESGNGSVFNKAEVLLRFNATNLFAFIDTDANNGNSIIAFAPDDKWHHFVLAFKAQSVGGDGNIYLAIDGKWAASYITQNTATGAYISDAAADFIIGSNSTGTQTFDGAVGWFAISNINTRYTVGTDFVPSRQPPGVDGNHVEMWHLDEGTGAIATAEVTSPANDGTIANGVWEAQWDIEGSPLVPYSVEFDGSATSINCGSHADIDDLADNLFVAEAWIRVSTVDTNKHVYVKGNGSTTGWLLGVQSGVLLGKVFCNTTDASSQALHSVLGMGRDDKWHHILMIFNDAGDRKVYLAVDGIWASAYDEQIAGNGAITPDAAQDLFIGYTSTFFAGAMGFARLSDNARYTVGLNFIPPSRLNPPAPDGNTMAQWNFRDGAGTTLTDTEGNSDGTITFGDGRWRITPDMEIDAPGHRIFNWGYVIGNDAGDEGITQIHEGLTPGTDYVLRAVLHTGPDSRGVPKIVIRDETNANDITELIGPFLVGVHDGGMGSVTLDDSTARWPQMLVGWTLYNITDGSSTTVTAIDGAGQVATGVLAGGTDDWWDIGDEYRFVPPGAPSEMDDYPWIETFCFELPTVDRDFTISADCVDISVKIVNSDAEGTIYVQQLELLENLIDNPSLEVQQQIDSDSYTLNIGTLESGNLAATEVRDGSYMEIGETVGTPGTDIEFTFPVDGVGTSFRIWGRYQGNVGHNVDVDAWNQGTTTWDNLGTLVHAVADALHTYALLAAHTNAGVVTVRINHTSPGNAAHRFWFDKLFTYQDPWIPDGWTNQNLDTGDTEAEAMVLHSGAQAIEWNAGADAEFMTLVAASTIAKFYGFGWWVYGDGSNANSPRLRGASTGQLVLHSDSAITEITPLSGVAAWYFPAYVARATATNFVLRLHAGYTPVGDRFYDDHHVIELDNVSLTATPTSEANSLESGGLRIDGFDNVLQPIPVGMLGATSGHITWNYLPRHDSADVLNFNPVPEIVRFWLDATRYIDVHYSAASIIRLEFNDGGGVHFGTWNPATLVANTEYVLEVIYSAVQMEFIVDGVVQITIVTPINFTGIPTFAYWGSDQNGAAQGDAVFIAP